MPMPDEITFESLAEDSQAPLDRLSKVIDAIDAASDQDHTTWITGDDGRRIAKIAPVDETPDDVLGRLREMTGDEITRIARDELDELLEFAGQIRAAMRTTKDAYDALFGASGARLLRAGRPQSPLVQGQAVLFCCSSPGSDWEPGVFIRYDGGSDAVLQDAGGHPVITTRSRVVSATLDNTVPLARRLAAKRAGTEPVWREAMAATEPGKLAVSRGLLVQVLTDAGLDEAKAGTVWDALRDLAQGLHPDGKPPGNPARSGRLKPLRPAGGLITVQAVQDALTLAGVHVSEEIIRNWSNGRAGLAYDWAMREHLHASDNEVVRVPRPSFLPGAETRDDRP